MKILASLILILLFLLLTIQVTHALPTSPKVEISAEKFELIGQGEKILAEGNVLIEGEDLFILADLVVYDIKRNLLTLNRFQAYSSSDNTSLVGNSGTLDLNFNEIFGDRVFLFLKKQGIRIKAFGFQKNSLNEYRAERAIITTCELDCDKEDFPPWSVEVKNFIFSPDELSRADFTKFRAGSLPLLYLPKSVFIPRATLPIIQDRKRGFLLPNFAQGNRIGIGVQIPFFLPITDQIDFTISPFYLTKRGLLFDLENRVTLTQDIKTTFNYRFIADSQRGFYDPESSKSPQKRWWLIGKIDLGLKENLDLHLDVDLVSDKGFLEEFNVGEGGYNQVRSRLLENFSRDLEDKNQDFRTSSLWLQGHRASLYGRFVSSYYDYHGIKDEKSILQPLANFHLSILPSRWRNLLPSLVLDYHYHYRRDGYYGHRLSPKLEVNLPLKTYHLKNLLTLSYTQTQYYLYKENGLFEDNSFSRGSLAASFATYTILKRFHELTWLNKPSLSFEHVLKPYAVLRWRSKPTRERVPLFVEDDLYGNKTFALEYGLWQFFNLPWQYNFLVLRATQTYDLEKAKRSATALPPEERALSDLYLRAYLQSSRISARYDTTYNFYGFGFKKHTFSITAKNLFLERITFLYQHDKAWKTRQAIIDLYETIQKKLALHFYASRNLILNETSELKFELAYLHDCYLLGFGVTTTPKDTKLHLLINLVGLGGIFKEL